MIEKALQILVAEIDGYLHRMHLEIEEEKKIIEPTSILKHDGSIAIPQNSLGFCLVNIEEERVLKAQNAVSISSDGQIAHRNPELKLNLFILIAANPKDNDGKAYLTSAALLSGVIRFFQSKSVFDHHNTPGLDPGLQKLVIELYTLGFEAQNHLWASMGANYLPSILYKVRLISIQEAQKIDEQKPIRGIDALEKVL